MFFRRNKKPVEPRAVSADDRREAIRKEPADRSELEVSLEPWISEGHAGEVDECLVLQLEPPLDHAVRGRLVDLCIQGASVRVTRREISGLEENHTIGLRIKHPTEGWEVVTPAMVRLIARSESNAARVGLEFVNPGQLYSQLQDELGRYFNRRTALRVRPQGEQPELRIKVKGTRIAAQVFDVSVVGVGCWVDTVLAAGLTQGSEVSFTLSLPGYEPSIEGKAFVARLVPQGRVNFVGLQFLVRGGSDQVGAASQVTSFVNDYLDESLRWSA